MNNLTIGELEVCFGLVIDKLKKDGCDSISFQIDEYWFVTTDEWNEFSKLPECAVGSLVYDIANLKKAIARKEIFSYSDFDSLASILRAISEIQAPTHYEEK